MLCSIILPDCNQIWNSSSDFQVSRQFDQWKPHCCMWAMLPSFHALSENTFKLILNFLTPVTLSATFPHSSARYQQEVYAWLNSFVFLGTLNTADNNTSAEINNRITLANRSYFGLVNILKAKNINRKYKVVIYKTLIKPVLIYGAETWVLSKAGWVTFWILWEKSTKKNLWN